MDSGNGASGSSSSGGGTGPSGQPNTGVPGNGVQIMQQLMRMTPEQRNAIIAKNPQLKAFLMHMEQKRRMHLQQQQLAQQQQQQHQQQQAGTLGQSTTGPTPTQVPAPIQPGVAVGSPPGPISAAPAITPYGISQQPELDHINKDQIPNRPLQKKSLKRKALSGTSFSSEGEIAADGQDAALSDTDAGFHTGADGAAGITKGTYDDFNEPFLSSTHDWSKEMQKHGIEPTMDVRIYEEMTTKDLMYQRYINSMIKAAESSGRKVNESVGINGKLMKNLLKDLSFYQKVKAARMQSMKLPSAANELTSNMWGEGYSGYGSGFTHGKVEFVFPSESKSAQFGIADDVHDLSKLAHTGSGFSEESNDNWVPIRLEFDVDRDGFRLVDTFVWNSTDSEEMMNMFVDELIRDYRIDKNVSAIREKIIHSMREQISEQQPSVENPQIDLRFPITLDITVANNQLTDKFDWDLMNKENDPEEFAETLCQEMSLPFEFQTAIAHSIREQCQIYLKSLYLIGYKFDGGAIISEDLKEYLRSSVDQNSVMLPRYLLSDFSASVQELSVDNLEKVAKERERESKRRKRGGATRVGRRGGFVLPDLSNMPKTLRTPIPGAVLPGSVVIDRGAEGFDEEEIPLEDHIPLEQTTALRQALLSESRQQNAVRQWLGRVHQQRMAGERVLVSATAKPALAGEKGGLWVSVAVKTGSEDSSAGGEGKEETGDGDNDHDGDIYGGMDGDEVDEDEEDTSAPILTLGMEN